MAFLMPTKFASFIRPFIKMLSVAPIANCNIRANYSREILELGKAKENVYFLKLQQKQLRMIRNKLKDEDKALSAKIKAQKKILKLLKERAKTST